ncbi:LOW QUALITY PROTEIN: aminopeptidase Ey [Drosophila tropicalis]|uniref:LOW QUALITY PROTEIN: aminopeptidase Ey n=1 Tax=Drosophila tropicalis TaxID=46794 RepID=UPI0035ABB631
MWQLLFVLLVIWQGEINRVNASPSDLRPLSYNLTISTHLNGGPNQNRYVGLVSIRLLVIKETRQVILNYRDISISSEHTMLIRNSSGLRIGIASTKSLEASEEFLIEFRNRLLKGEVYSLYMVFSGNMAKPQRNGYYASFYKDDSSSIGKKMYSMAQFEREYARTAFPCFDEPQFRTNFTLYLAHHSDYLALSNMPAAETWKHPTLDGYLWTRFAESPPLATHMFTWALHQLDILSQTKTDDGTMVTIWGRPQFKAYLINDVVELTKFLLPKSETLFGVPLPLGNTTERKIDHIVLPQHPQNIYKRGLMVYRENMLRKGTGQEWNLSEMVAIYFVRQWNGILISASSWAESWIFDGLTAYLSIQLVNQLVPMSGYNQTRLLDLSLWVKQEDSMSQAVALKGLHTNKQQESLRVSKLCLLLNMMNSFIGLKVMETGLKAFWLKYANTTATGMQLWTELQEAARRAHLLPRGIDLNHVMDSWLNQQGYPLLVVNRNYEDNTVTITQQRYTAVTLPSNPCWWIPITYITQRDRTPHQEWLSCDDNVSHPDEWILINVNGSNLQRTLYDLKNWAKLHQVLSTDIEQIPPINRAHLVDDALNLAWHGMLPYSVALSIVGYLTNETNHYVWQVAIYNLEKLHTILHTTTGYRIFRTYMRTIVKVHFSTILKQLEKNPEKINRKFLRTEEHSSLLPSPDIQMYAFIPIIYRLACHFQLAACVKDAAERFNAAVQDPAKEIPDGLRETVYCMAVRHGMELEWLFLRDKYNVTETISERRILLRAMACSVDHWALEKLLQWSFDRSKVPKLLTVDLLSAVAHNSVGFILVKKYLSDHIDDIKRMYDIKGILEILQSFVNVITTREDLENFKDFVQENLPRISNYTIASFFEAANAKVDWRQYRYYDLLKAIREVTIIDDD